MKKKKKTTKNPRKKNKQTKTNRFWRENVLPEPRFDVTQILCKSWKAEVIKLPPQGLRNHP